jgi:hypothetical protein
MAVIWQLGVFQTSDTWRIRLQTAGGSASAANIGVYGRRCTPGSRLACRPAALLQVQCCESCVLADSVLPPSTKAGGRVAFQPRLATQSTEKRSTAAVDPSGRPFGSSAVAVERRQQHKLSRTQPRGPSRVPTMSCLARASLSLLCIAILPVGAAYIRGEIAGQKTLFAGRSRLRHSTTSYPGRPFAPLDRDATIIMHRHGSIGSYR